MGNYWELKGNMVGTYWEPEKNGKKILLPHPTKLKRKKCKAPSLLAWVFPLAP